MKVLAVSDLHIDAGSMPGGSYRDPLRVRESNIELCRDEIFPAIDEIIAERKIDMVVTTGDVFDSSHPTLKAVSTVRSWVKSLPVPSVHITGNHELIGLSRFDDNILEYALGDIPGATIVSEPTVIDGMAMIPWPTTHDWKAFLKAAPRAPIMFGHLELDDVVDYASKGITSSMIAEKWPIAILGHYHKRTLTPANTVGYVGSVKPPRFTSGEIETPAAGVAIVDGSSVELVDIEVSRRCRKVDASDITEEFVADLTASDAVIVVGQTEWMSDMRRVGALVGSVLPEEEKTVKPKAKSSALKTPIDYVKAAVKDSDDEKEIVEFFTEFLRERGE